MNIEILTLVRKYGNYAVKIKHITVDILQHFYRSRESMVLKMEGFYG
jgi:hypothetical protein